MSFEKKDIAVGEPISIVFKAKDPSQICHDGMPQTCIPDRHVQLNLVDPLTSGPSINATHKIESLGDSIYRLVISPEAYGQRAGIFVLQDFYLYDDRGNLGKWNAWFPDAPRISIRSQTSP